MAIIEFRNPNALTPGPIRHEHLPPELVHRIETVCSVLADVFPMTAGEWIDSLRRDLVPEPEVVWWERVAGCYLELTAKVDLPLHQRKIAFKIIFSLFSGGKAKELGNEAAQLPQSAKSELAAILRKFARIENPWPRSQRRLRVAETIPMARV